MSAAASPTAVPGDLVVLGAVRGAYGIKGWVRITPFSADATTLTASRCWWLVPVGPGGRERSDDSIALEVTAVKQHSGDLLAKWRGCDTPEAADELIGCAVGISRAEFPAAGSGEYYWVDLIGAHVVNRQGDRLGLVAGVRSNGVHDLLEIGDEGLGKPEASRLIPLIPLYVDDVDLANRRITVDWQLDWS